MGVEMTTVYVLTREHPHEGEALFGVYLTEEDAKRASEQADVNQNDESGSWCVYLVEVGAYARYYGWNDRAEGCEPSLEEVLARSGQRLMSRERFEELFGHSSSRQRRLRS